MIYINKGEVNSIVLTLTTVDTNRHRPNNSVKKWALIIFN